MAVRDQYADSSDSGADYTGGAGTSQNWWEGPPPPGYTGPWPPPLGPGQKYGQAFGSIDNTGMTAADPNFGIYGPSGGSFNDQSGLLPGETPTPAAVAAPPAGGGTTAPAAVNPGTQTTGVFDPNAGQDFQFPTFTPPTYTPTPAFSYADFKAPTLDEASAQPGYQFGLNEGLKALQTAQASKGLLRTGGSLKDLFSWGSNAANQNYGNVLAQDAGIYSTNRANAADTWQKNYDANNTNWTNADTAAQQAFQPQMAAAQLKFGDLYNRWLASVGATSGIAAGGAT